MIPPPPAPPHLSQMKTNIPSSGTGTGPDRPRQTIFEVRPALPAVLPCRWTVFLVVFRLVNTVRDQLCVDIVYDSVAFVHEHLALARSS